MCMMYLSIPPLSLSLAPGKKWQWKIREPTAGGEEEVVKSNSPHSGSPGQEKCSGRCHQQCELDQNPECIPTDSILVPLVQNTLVCGEFSQNFYMLRSHVLFTTDNVCPLQKQQQQQAQKVAIVKPLVRSPASQKPFQPTRDHAPQPHPHGRLPSLSDSEETEASQVR